MSRLNIAFINAHATSKDVAREVKDQVRILDDMLINYTKSDILAMCRCENVYHVQRLAHDLKFS